MNHPHEPKIYPPECTRAAAHLRKLKGNDHPSNQIIAEAEDALTRAALELHFLETLMRTAVQTLTELLARDLAKEEALKQSNADRDAAKTALADAEEANSEFQTALDTLQKKYDDLVKNPPAGNPDDTIPADNPARVQTNTLLDSDAPVGDPVPANQ